MVKSNFSSRENERSHFSDQESEEQKIVDSKELGSNILSSVIASSHHSSPPKSSYHSSSYSSSSKRAKGRRERKVKASSNSKTHPSSTIRSRTKTRAVSVFQGPIGRRKCTDLSCCILFLTSMVVWISLGVAFATYLYTNHGLSFGLAPMDSLGNRCGHGNFSTKPYLFFFNIADCINAELLFGVIGCGTNGSAQVCVSHCPNVTFSIYDQLNSITNDSKNDSWLEKVICKYHIGVPTMDNIEEHWQKGDCAAYYLESEPLLDRCIPKVIRFEEEKAVDNVQDSVMLFNKSGETLTLEKAEQVTDGLNRLLAVGIFGQNLLEDLINSWGYILLVIFFGILLSIFWLYSLAYFTRIVIWTSLIAMTTFFIFLTYFTASKYSQLSQPTNSTSGNNTSFERTANKSIITNSSSKEDHHARSGLDQKHMQITMYFFKDALQSKVENAASAFLGSSLWKSSTLWLTLTIICSVVLIIFLLAALLLADRINLAVQLIEETSTALASLRVVVVLLLPLVPYLFQLFSTVLWVAISVVLLAARRPTYLTDSYVECVPSEVDGGDDGSCKLRNLLTGTSLLLAELYSFFCFQWLFYFLEALYIISLAGCFSTFYWQPPLRNSNQKTKSSRLPKFISLHSVKTAIRYHLGTLAFGAFFAAILRTIRLLVDCLHSRLKSAVKPEGAAGQSAVAATTGFSFCSSLCSLCTSIPLLMWIFKALLALTERLLSFLNRQTYLMTAIYGGGFCASASEAVGLLAANPLRAVVLYALSHYLMSVCRILITITTAISGYLLFYSVTTSVDNFTHLHYRWAPVLVASVVTYLLSSLYVDIYEVGIDTMFLCFLLDDKLHDGSRRRPFFMPNATRKRLLQLDSEVKNRSSRSYRSSFYY